MHCRLRVIEGEKQMIWRQHERFEFFKTILWDFFAKGNGRKKGHILNISHSGCLIKTLEPIESRRWIRILISSQPSHPPVLIIGRVVRTKPVKEGNKILFYYQGIEFTHPHYFSVDSTHLILALSRRNFKTASCLSASSKCSL